MKIDWDLHNLPTNRFEVFFDAVRQRYLLFFRLGLAAVLCTLPLLALTVIKDFSLYNIIDQVSEGVLSEEGGVSRIFSIRIWSAVMRIPLLIIASIGLCGICGVLRQLAWGEGIFYREDFKDGIKRGAATFSVTALLAGILLLINECASFFGNPFGKYLILTASLLVAPILILAVLQSEIYRASYLGYIRNATVMYVRELPKTLLWLLLTALPLTVVLIQDLFLKYLLIFFAAFLWIPLACFVWVLYANAVFDRYINQKEYPQLYKKGIFEHQDSLDLDSDKPSDDT